MTICRKICRTCLIKVLEVWSWHTVWGWRGMVWSCCINMQGNPGRSTLLSFGNKRNMICFE